MVDNLYIAQNSTSAFGGYDPSRVRLGKHPRREGTRRESRISGTSCRGYQFAGVQLVQLPQKSTDFLLSFKTVARKIKIPSI